MTAENPIIRTKGLTRRFGDFVAVDDLSIEVQPGWIFAFLGANGSGKSTTIRMLIGLLTPTAGEIELDGVDVIRHPRLVRERIGYMGQKVSLYSGLTLRENVEFYAGLYGLTGLSLDERWGELRERFDLALVEEERCEALPAGIRQRSGLALSMLHRPRVLFLDEPTAGVDVQNRGLFWEVIQAEADAGVTVFVTTHFLEEADYCDWVSFIDRGRLIANASPAELRARFSPGYRIYIDVPDRSAAKVRQILQAEPGVRLVEAETDGVGLSSPDSRSVGSNRGSAIVVAARSMNEGVERVLRRVEAADTEVKLQILQPEMGDVFRQVIASAGRGQQ